MTRRPEVLKLPLLLEFRGKDVEVKRQSVKEQIEAPSNFFRPDNSMDINNVRNDDRDNLKS